MENLAHAKNVKNGIFEWPALSLNFGVFFGSEKDKLACSSTVEVSSGFRFVWFRRVFASRALQFCADAIPSDFIFLYK